MDDMNAFEKLVAEEAEAEAGPSRPTDVAAVLSSVATKSPRWRFWSMFSATKSLTATAVIALFGGILLAGPLQPNQEETVVPAAVGDEAEGPMEFRARWLRAGDSDRGVVESNGDLVTYRDQRWNIMAEVPGDPRLDGEIDLHSNADAYSGVVVASGYFRIETDDGVWLQRPSVHGLKLTGDRDPAGFTAVFDGLGAYDGLVAIMNFSDGWEHWDIKGVILEAPLPPTPQDRG